MMGREQNDRERALVVGAIAAERPSLLAITGDCVFDGGSASQWAAFDRLMTPVREAGIPVIAAVGNHEYWGGSDGGRALFERVAVGQRAYTVDLPPLRIVVLDSNHAMFSRGEWADQLAFYRSALAAADADPAVRGVMVLFHHPPFTNSTVTGDDLVIQRDLLQPFLDARKTLVLQNGHVHSYERFVRGGKMLVVSGGGGGPRAALATGDDRRHPDDVAGGPALRDFNFVVYTLDGDTLTAETRGLSKGGTDFRVIDRFALRWVDP
jgi:hypothetical protein